MATMKRCLAQLNIKTKAGEEFLQPGMEVNIDRELYPGFTLGEAIRGREDCFEDLISVAVVPVQKITTKTPFAPSAPEPSAETKE